MLSHCSTNFKRFAENTTGGLRMQQTTEEPRQNYKGKRYTTQLILRSHLGFLKHDRSCEARLRLQLSKR